MRPTNDWGGGDGSFWAAHAERYDAMLAPLTGHLMAAAGVRPTDHVLDVGCGCGETTRLAAHTAASVLGVDIAEPMLAKARELTVGMPNIRFERADAQVTPFEPVDLVLSRFGVMFFADLVAAFTNLRRALRPDGRLVFLCWQALELNENRVIKRAALAPHVPVPDPTPGVGAMSLADPVRVRVILQTAGFDEVELTDVRERLPAGRDADDTTEFQLREPATAGWLAGADPEAAAKAAEAVHAAYQARETPDGVFVSSAAWLVTAR